MTVSISPTVTPAPAPATRLVGIPYRRYSTSANTTSAPRPSTRPYQTVANPHSLPTSALSTAATSSVYTAAPGRRTISAPSTAGNSQTPTMTADAGGTIASRIGADAVFQTANTRPPATPRTLATTMSTTRQRPAVAVAAATATTAPPTKSATGRVRSDSGVPKIDGDDGSPTR